MLTQASSKAASAGACNCPCCRLMSCSGARQALASDHTRVLLRRRCRQGAAVTPNACGPRWRACHNEHSEQFAVSALARCAIVRKTRGVRCPIVTCRADVASVVACTRAKSCKFSGAAQPAMHTIPASTMCDHVEASAVAVRPIGLAASEQRSHRRMPRPLVQSS